MSELLFPSDVRWKPSRFGLAALLVFLALSLASVRHKHEGWQGGDRFEIEADGWELGAPLPWFSWVRVTATGEAPPMETLPEGSDYLPGPRSYPVSLVLAIAFAAGLVWAASNVWRRLRPQLARRDSLPSAAALAAAAYSGALVRVLVEVPHPTWVGWGYALLPLPLITVALCWRRPRTWLAAAYLASALLGMEIAQMGFKGRPLVDRALDPKQDFLPQITFLVVYLLAVAAILALLRRMRGPTHQPAP